MALPEIRSSEGLSLFIISRFHGAAAASLLVPADLGAEIICDVVWFLNALRPFHAQRRTRRRPVELPHGTFHGPISNLGVQLSSASQRRSIAAARSCMFRPRKRNGACPVHARSARARHWAVFHVVTQGWPPGSAQRGDLGFARPLVSGSSITVCSTAIGPGAGWQGTSPGNAPNSRARCCHPWTDLTGLDYRGTWGTIDGEHAGNGS